MGEYMKAGDAHGAPPGYVGYDEGGQLTEAVHGAVPVVLLDEIEKAHPDVFNVHRRYSTTDVSPMVKVELVDLTNAVLIMTSNLPEIRHRFKPEFLNWLTTSSDCELTNQIFVTSSTFTLNVFKLDHGQQTNRTEGDPRCSRCSR